MRKLFLLFIVLFVSTSLIVSCTSDSENIEENAINQKSDFLNDFYSNEYRFGKSVNATSQNTSNAEQRTIQVGNYSITEVIVGDDTRARGYIFENLTTGEVESFVDVDRTNFVLTSVDLNTLESEIQSDINQNPQYLLSHEYDIIKGIEEPITIPNPSDPQVGTDGWHYDYGACVNGKKAVFRAYYLFGIRLTKWSAVYDDEGHIQTVDC